MLWGIVAVQSWVGSQRLGKPSGLGNIATAADNQQGDFRPLIGLDRQHDPGSPGFVHLDLVRLEPQLSRPGMGPEERLEMGETNREDTWNPPPQ